MSKTLADSFNTLIILNLYDEVVRLNCGNTEYLKRGKD